MCVKDNLKKFLNQWGKVKVDGIAWCRQSMKRLSLKRKLGAVDEKNSTHQIPVTKQKDAKSTSNHLRANAR